MNYYALKMRALFNVIFLRKMVGINPEKLEPCLDLPANQHNQFSSILFQKDRIGCADWDLSVCIFHA